MDELLKNKFINRILEVGLTWLDFYPYSAK